MTIKQAILKIKETQTYKDFLEAAGLVRTKGEYNLTRWEKMMITVAEIKMIIMVRDFTVPILQNRMIRNEEWKKKGVYTGKPEDNARKFFEVLQHTIWKILPDYGDFFEKYSGLIEKEIYSLSLN